MARKTQTKTPERFLGAEEKCINREQEEIVRWLRTVKFKKKLVGGVDEVQLWKKMEELYGMYERAIRAERIRYDSLLAQAGVAVAPAAPTAPTGEGTETGTASPDAPASPHAKEGC